MHEQKKVVRKAYVAVISDGRVLMTQDVEGYPGWKFPGGHVEVGETIEQGATREILEEVALAITLGKIFFEEKFVPPGRTDELHLRTFFIAFAGEGEATPRSGEVKEARWFLPSEIVQMNEGDIYTVQKDAIAAFLRSASL